MNKQLLLSLILIAGVVILPSGTYALTRKVDNFGMLTLLNKKNVPQSRNESEQKFFSAIIELTEESDLNELKNLGAVIFNQRENLVLACIPLDKADEINLLASVSRCAVSKNVSATLDKALPATNVPSLLQGNGFSSKYTGKGVTVGFSDIGFDPGHAAFSGRVKAILHAVDSTATVIRSESASEIDGWDTDSRNEFHATHVGGILAGADTSSPYMGVAREADIIATTSCLYDVGILIGVEEIISKAKEAQQPAVVNLSLGSTIGPHDGTDLFCQYLDLCAEDATIVLSAGNNGATRIHAGKALTSSATVMSVMVESSNWSNILLNNGYIDVWSSNGHPLKLRLRVWNRYINDIVWTSEWMSPTGSDYFVINTVDYPEFDKLFNGTAIAASEVSPYNGRYNMTVGLDLGSTTTYPGNEWSQHSLVIDIEGEPGTTIDMCTNGNIRFYTTSTAYPWITGGDSELSVSSLACGFNTICVGSATTRDTAPRIDGTTSSWESFVTAGTVSNYSSYGITYDGRELPHFCAPGAYVVSAYNRYAIEEHPELKAKMAAESPDNPGHYYFAECGTSMAAPHAAGIFALWLQADPSLTSTELRDIAIKTARYEGVSSSNPRSGAGMIDAAAGLAYILKAQGITDVENDIVTVWRNDGYLAINGAPSNSYVEIYTLTGLKIYAGIADNVALPASPVIVRLFTPASTVTRKLM